MQDSTEHRLSFLFLCRGWRRCCPLAAGRHNVLDPHVGHKISVVLPVVYIVEIQRAQFWRIGSEQLHELTSGRVGHSVVSFIAIGEGGLESGNVRRVHLDRVTVSAEEPGD